MKSINTCILFILSPVFFYGQTYNTALGIRLGTDWGVTVQQRLTKRSSIEGILQSSLQREEILLTGLYEQHLPILGKRLNIYYGGGLHKGWINEDLESGVSLSDPFGVTLIGGIEFTLARINISYDLKPAINLRGGEKNFYTQSGISLRYVLLKKKKHKKGKTRKQKIRRM